MIYIMNAYKLEQHEIASYLNGKEEVSELIDCFKVNKYQSIDEQILYISMNIYRILEKPHYIDEVFEKYSKENKIELSINLERLLYLALTFLFSLDIIDTSENMIRRKK